MKKIFLTLSSTFFLLISNPIFAQVTDPGTDPDAPAAPIDSYVWALALAGLIYVLFRVRFLKQELSTQN